MRVLHVIPSFAPAWRYGGPIVAAHGLTRELARQGHDVAVMTTNIDGRGVLDVPLQRTVDMEGVDVWYSPVQWPRWYCFSRPLGRELRRRTGEFDIVHVHSIYLWPTTAAAYWCRRQGVPYVIRTTGSLDPTMLAKPYGRWRDSTGSRVKKWVYLNTVGRRDLGGAAAIHFTSRTEMEVSRRYTQGVPGHVLPLGVDPPEAAQAAGAAGLRSRYPELRDRKIVLFLSRLDPIKGLEIVIEALARLQSGRDDFALVVAGDGADPYVRQVSSLINESGIRGRTVLLGLVEGRDKWSALREADVFVLPSHHESFGVAVVEAMAVGLPVVISDRVDIHPEVRSAGAGLVTSLDPADVEAAVGTLLADEGLRSKMGTAGAALARERYSWNRAARNIVGMYEEVVDGRRATPSGVVTESTDPHG